MNSAFLTRALVPLFLLATTSAFAQLDWRVSVKFILDADNHRAASGELNTDEQLHEKFDRANQILDSYGRGYRFKIVEILNVPGVSPWFDKPVEPATAVGLRAAIDMAPGAFLWNENAINIYVLGSQTSGETRSGLIIVGQDHANINTVFHECGHHLNLRHTFNTQMNCDSDIDGDTDCGCDSFIPGDDEVSDTLLDHRCFRTKDQIVLANNFGASYDALDAMQKARVDMVFTNLMCYRGTRAGLSPDQLDRMTDASNGFRNNIANGRTWLVDAASTCPFFCGSSSSPFPTVSGAVSTAGEGDIVLIRKGRYPESLTISKRVFLRASRGSAELGAR